MQAEVNFCDSDLTGFNILFTDTEPNTSEGGKKRDAKMQNTCNHRGMDQTKKKKANNNHSTVHLDSNADGNWNRKEQRLTKY